MRFFFSISILLISFSQAQAENQHGLFMVVKGDVKVISGEKPPFAVKVGSKVFAGDTVTTGADSRAKIVMVDRNVINISPDSKVQIAKYSTDPATGNKNVEIKLDEGKVRNNVEQSYDGAKSKFILKTPTAVAGVRGTQFVTSFDSKTQKTDIVTMKGQVAFASVLNGKIVGKPVIVNKGEMTTSSAGAPPEAPKSVPKNEMKEVDKESTAANHTKKGEGPPGKEGGPESKDGAGPKDAKVGPNGPGKDGGPIDGERKPASMNNPMNNPMDNFGADDKPPICTTCAPLPPPPPTAPKGCPPICPPPIKPPLLDSGSLMKTKLIIIPQ